jgi:hypothetical protein
VKARHVLGVTGLLALAVAAPAAATPPTHVDQFDQWVEPVDPSSGCPAYLISDVAHIVGTGHGLDTETLLKNGDFRAASTFQGSATATFYDPANVDAVYGSDGIESATPTGPSDVVVAGTLKQTFHVSQNQQTTTLTITFAFRGAGPNGTVVNVHGTSHGTWLPGSDPENDPPTLASSHTIC